MRAYGLDFSKWALDWIKPENAPIDFAIQRTSWGLHTDERYENHSQRMNQVDCRMAYHFYSSAVPWKEQVDYFLDLVNNNPYTNYQAIWWDYEEKYNNLSNRTAREAAEAIRYLRMGFKGRVGIYTNRNDYTVRLAPYIDRIWLDVSGEPPKPEPLCREKQILDDIRGVLHKYEQ